MESLSIYLNGARGRMGQAILCAAQSRNVRIAAAVDMGDEPNQGWNETDVCIDFSFHTVTLATLELALKYNKPVVIGTTGHTADEKQAILEYAQKLPIVWAGNYSVGVNLLFYLTKKAASILTPDFQAEILELHHRHKKDAPSGTAENLLSAIQSVRPQSTDVKQGRHGITGERTQDEIGMHAIRGGQIIGEHTVYFIGESERVELTHRASDRSIFANGALHAAGWLKKQSSPGLYNMEDVLGLRNA
jgi:4-hydroxy-tetrahydrodipicolinate reductase